MSPTRRWFPAGPLQWHLGPGIPSDTGSFPQQPRAGSSLRYIPQVDILQVSNEHLYYIYVYI